MPRLQAAVTAFWAAMFASLTASSRSPAPGSLGSHPAVRKASYHLRQSAQNTSTIFAFAMKGWSSQLLTNSALSASSVTSMIV